MSVYATKPWLARYDAGQPAELSLEYSDALAMFGASVRRNPDGDIIRYFGGRITARELDELSDAFAVALAALGVRAGDRVLVCLEGLYRDVARAVIEDGGLETAVVTTSELDYRARDDQRVFAG